MKPHSIEFRQKIIEVHEKESISIRKLAQRFCVAKSFIQKLLKQYKDTGDIHHYENCYIPARSAISVQSDRYLYKHLTIWYLQQGVRSLFLVIRCSHPYKHLSKGN